MSLNYINVIYKGSFVVLSRLTYTMRMNVPTHWKRPCLIFGLRAGEKGHRG